MQKGQNLQFDCQNCHQPIDFSIFDVEHSLECHACKRKYAFNDENLVRQLKKFTLLCRQLIESEEILGNTTVGIDVGENKVKIPFKLLLTRLTPNLDLMIGNQPVSIRFRIEPLKM